MRPELGGVGVRAPAVREREPAPALVRNGAEAVHLAEELYVRFFKLTLWLVLVGVALALWFGELAGQREAKLATALFAAAAGVLAALALARPDRAYRLLRSRPALQVAPAALGALAVLAGGPDSPCWWVALPLLWVVSIVASMRAAIAAALVTAAAYLAGTLLGGQPLIAHSDAGVLAGGVGLPAYTFVGRVLVEGFSRLILGLHRLADEHRQATPRPLRVPNLAMAPATPAAPAAPTRVRRRPGRPLDRRSPLTARQLEIVLLARDGLRHAEIAACLSISERQVERHLAGARERAGASTTSQVLAMLVRGELGLAAPGEPQRTAHEPQGDAL